MDEIQKLLDIEAQLGNLKLEIVELIKQKRGSTPPPCWGQDDCSSEFLIRCPWRVDCGDQPNNLYTPPQNTVTDEVRRQIEDGSFDYV